MSEKACQANSLETYKQDAATGDIYYVNTWNQEIRWVKPLEISLFEDCGGTKRPGTGNSSKLSFADDDDDGDGVGGADSVGGRFRQRLVDLTKEAALAAEEEEKFLRYVAANAAALVGDTGDNARVVKDGTDSDVRRERFALAAAKEWRFVRTDASFVVPSPGADVKKKCWYHSVTSEYFWGDHPPLLALFRLQIGDDLQWHEGERIASAGNGRIGASNSGGSDLGGGSTLAGSGGPCRGVEPVATLHPKFGLIFADRASGEAWLKAQELSLLLEKSEKVCDLGPAGWCQLKAVVPSSVPVAGGAIDNRISPNPTALTNDLGGNSCSGPAVPALKGDGHGRQVSRGRDSDTESGREVGQHPGSSVEVVRVDEAAAAQAPAVLDAEITLPNEGPSMPCHFFTFFHRAETGEVRWCLSPRSALPATSDTAGREASHAGLTSHDQSDGWTGQSMAGDEQGFAQATTAADRQALAFTSSDNSVFSGDSDGWKVVEDGDMVFYYNQKLGVSTWEPPPGWDLGDDQETSGAGG